MRLRSIPPRTMATVANEQRGLAALGQLARLQQNLALAVGGLEKRAGMARPDAEGGVPGAEAWDPGRNPAKRTALGRRGAHGRYYNRPSARRSSDLVISARPDSGPTVHAVQTTAEAVAVHVQFPVPVEPTEVAWELHGDVLEVEYIGKAFSYHHAFLVPAETKPYVELGARSVAFRFLQQS